MAIYHLSAQVISRSQGRSSVAASAYRSAEKLVDERTGLTHDFTQKSDVVEQAILLPNDAPAWMANRETLWNAVEQVEKRQDAQLAREMTIALPRELSSEQNWALLKAFVQQEFVDQGMVADVAFHRGHPGGEDQPHGHVMLTLREVTPDGFGHKVRAWNGKGLLKDWRERWAEHCNLALARQGFDLRIDHRTLEAQGINLEAQSKIGPKAAQRAMVRLAEHQALAQRNGDRLFKEPEIALTAITRQQSTFTHQDLARFVNRHTVDSRQFDAVFEKIKAHPELVHLGQDDQQRDRFTTRDLLALETQMIHHVTQKSQTAHHLVAEQLMTQAMADKQLSDEQQVALKHLTQGDDVACVVGFAGTGKSYMLGAAREAWEAQGYRVQGMTLSGIAAQNLVGGSGIQSHTVASRLWHWERDRERLTANDIVVVDEAGMLGSRQMAKIIEEAHRAGAKVTLVGDSEQLQAIEAGAAFRAMAERVGFVQMSEIRRQREPWQQQATRDFARERTAEGLWAYEQHDHVHTFNTKEAAMTGLVEQWDEVRSQSRDKSQLMLAYTRDEVRALNEQARAMRHAQGELGQDHAVETSRGSRPLAEQDRLYFLRNENRALRVKNGTLGTIEKINGDQLIVRLDHGDCEQARWVEFSLKDYNDIDHGYAATVYKAQGVTVDRTHVLASKYFDRHSTYVAMSRHREGADLYVSRDDFPSFSNLSKNLSRERTKDVTLDYAQGRGFEREEQAFGARVRHSLTVSPAPHTTSEQQLWQAARDYDQRESLQAMSPRGDFGALKAEFEAAHPEQARALRAAIQPKHERLGLAAEQQWQQLEQAVRASRFPAHAQRQLETYAQGVAKQPSVMAYLQQRNPELVKKIEGLSKSRDRGLGRGYER
jgi:Ti-type conjugative transfer relaxase TraA